jgi:hypothetical protein
MGGLRLFSPHAPAYNHTSRPQATLTPLWIKFIIPGSAVLFFSPHNAQGRGATVRNVDNFGAQSAAV